jgi:hypothetical protein
MRHHSDKAIVRILLEAPRDPVLKLAKCHTVSEKSVYG